MMKFGDARLSYLAHHIVAVLKQEQLAQIEADRHVLSELKRVLGQEQGRDARIDETVRRKIASLSRRIPPGGREWDVLYQQYSAEERRKQKT